MLLNVLEYSHNINFDIEIELIIINNQNNIYLYSVLERILIYNQVEYNGFCKILNIQTEFKHNNICKYVYITLLQIFYVCVPDCFLLHILRVSL